MLLVINDIEYEINKIIIVMLRRSTRKRFKPIRLTYDKF